ncbi:MAG: glycosyltransferase, partial [Pseudomonadota bacterium]
PSLRRVRAKCFWAVGEREAGLAALREAAASGDARSVYQLVRALVDLGRLDEARGEADKVRQSNRMAASLVSLCRAVIELAALDLDKAAQHGKDAVDEDPSSAEALRILTSIEVTRLETARAWTALETLERHRKFRKVVASVALSRARLTIFGQMLNEFDLHPQVTERARDLLRSPPGDGVDGLRVEVAREPGHTGVAIAYLIASRRAGRLAKTVDAMVTEGGSSIPRIVHQYWSDKELPPDVERAIAATRQGAGAAEHRLYDTAAVRSFLLRYHSTVVQRAFRLAMEPARRADIFRLAVLAAVGGVYVDADDLCLTYVDGFLPNGAGLVVGQERLGTIANNVIAAAPRHPVIVAALEEASEAMLHYSNESIWLATGPGLLTRHVAHYLATSADHGADVAVLTDVEMTRAFAMHMPMRHKKSSADWRRGGSGRTRRKTR